MNLMHWLGICIAFMWGKLTVKFAWPWYIDIPATIAILVFIYYAFMEFPDIADKFDGYEQKKKETKKENPRDFMDSFDGGPAT